MPPSDVLRIATHYRAQLARQEAAEVRRLVQGYGKIYIRLVGDTKDLQRVIDGIRERGEPVPAWRIQQLERYKSTMAQLTDDLGRFNEQAEQAIKEMQRQAITAGIDMAEAQFNALVPPSIGITFNRLPTVALENMVGFLADGSPLNMLLRQLGDETARSVGDALLTGLGAGWNPRKTAKYIRQRAGMGLTRSLLIARTEQLRAWRVSSIQGYRDQGAMVKGFRRHASMSERTCIACLLEDGTLYATEDEFTDHPRGRCAVIPVTPSWEDLGFKGIEDTNVKWQSGRDWFGQQDDATQERILNKPIFDAWKSGQIALDDMKTLHRNPVWGDQWTASSLKGALGQAEFRKGQR